jgi:purine catabolism regulator
VIFDGRGEMLTGRAFRRELDQDEIAILRAGVRERITSREHQQFMPAIADPARGLVIPVAADGISASGSPTPEAWLAAIKDDAPLSDFDRLALRQAVTIVALELLRARVAGDTERRLAGDLLAGLLAGELVGPDLARRLEPFGINDTTAALVFQRGTTTQVHTNGAAQNGGSVRPNRVSRPVTAAAAEQALTAALRGEAASGLVASADQVVGALIPGLPDDELFALAERVAERLQRELPDEQIRLGAGRAVKASEAKRSFHEARCAVEALSFGLGDGSKIATYRDLGSFQLLLSLQDDEALKLFCDSILGEIEQSEGYYGGELMRSLEAFIEENGQWERAAKRLYCHRHTLRYRIRRVEELTGRNLGSARDRIEFWLALRGRELIS